MAQQTTTPAGSTSTGSNGQQTAQLQEVEVTGSRIKRTTDFNTPTPTTVIDTETMENLGIVNVGQALAITPANVSPFTPQTTGESSFYTGAYIPDLRGLNGYFSSRTLTLIDGQRAVSTNTSDQFDLNFVPQILVQRIDTVTGGASAAYGSGAVAGVLNIILDHTLEGGKIDADMYDTHYNDARRSHIGAAYGHGMFDDRLHFVIGAEYSKQDPALCTASGRPWCAANYGPYDIPGSYSLQNVALETLGANLRTTAVSTSGVIGAAQYNPAFFSYDNTSNEYGEPGGPLYSASSDGLGLVPYEGNGAAYGGAAEAPGGQGITPNYYTNLLTPVTRGVITAMLTGKITDNITANVSLNWGKVEANNPNNGANYSYGVLGLDNPFLPGGAASVDTTLGGAPALAYYYGKDWNAQIPDSQFNDTTLKRVTVSLDGKIGDSSWSWDGYWEYGLTNNVEGSPTEFHATEESMALDTVTGPNGQPECRITAALAANGGNIQAAMNQLTGFGPGTAYAAYPGGLFELPSYLETYALSAFSPVAAPPDPVDGLTTLQTDALLAQNCVPISPFGTTPLSTAQINYLTGPLSLALRQTQSVIDASTSGNFFEGIGAGPWSMAVGYEWRQEVTHNTFAQCPPGALTGEAEELCLAETTDFTYQFGNSYAGITDVDEGFLEFNLPLLKDLPWAHLLEVDIAGRESHYDNTSIYGVGITPGSSGTSTFPTWKTSIIFDPIQGLRFRATESRDERAPDPRDLYYSQTFVAGSFYGTCGAYANPAATSVPCNFNLTGNVDLKPEAANTTTAGIVLTPPQLPGFQASVDWFHIHLIDGINGGSGLIAQEQCATGHGAAACPGFIFNAYTYEAATGQPCNTAAGAQFPGAGACTGSTVTGAAAYQTGLAANILSYSVPAFNGAFYDERGVDFSLNYVTALPDGSTISARALTTFTDEEVYQNYAGGPIYNILGQEYGGFLADWASTPRWTGNLSVTWAKGAFSLTPNVKWLGTMAQNNTGLACSTAELANTSNPCYWVYHAYTDPTTGLPSTSPAQLYAKSEALSLLPLGEANYVPAYFVFGLNATYTFDRVLKGLQIWAQVDNLFNKSPPFTNATVSNPVYYDELGQAYTIGFRLNF